MKAVICTKYGPPEVLQLQEVEKPTPKHDEVLVKIHATSVTTSDCIIRGFKLPRWTPIGFMMGLVVGFTAPRKPILGMELAGELETVGQDVGRFKVGDQVYGSTFGPAGEIRFGAYAQYVSLPEDSLIAIKPPNLTYEEAAAIPYGFGMAMSYLKKGDIQSRRKVLIYGASGAIGTSAVQLAKAYGAEVTGVCSARNLDLVRSLGASNVIDYTKQDAPPEGERYDLVLDAVGKSKSSKLKDQCRKALTPEGQYVSVDDGSPKYSTEDLSFRNELVEADKLKAIVDCSYPLEEIVEAHSYVDQGHKRGNVVITVAHDNEA